MRGRCQAREIASAPLATGKAPASPQFPPSSHRGFANPVCAQTVFRPVVPRVGLANCATLALMQTQQGPCLLHHAVRFLSRPSSWQPRQGGPSSATQRTVMMAQWSPPACLQGWDCCLSTRAIQKVEFIRIIVPSTFNRGGTAGHSQGAGSCAKALQCAEAKRWGGAERGGRGLCGSPASLAPGKVAFLPPTPRRWAPKASLPASRSRRSC